jgi:hypothetical protein
MKATRHSINPDQLHTLVQSGLSTSRSIVDLQRVLWALGKFGFTWDELVQSNQSIQNRLADLVESVPTISSGDTTVEVAGSSSAMKPTLLHHKVASGMYQALGLLGRNYSSIDAQLRDVLDRSIEDGLANMKGQRDVHIILLGYIQANASFDQIPQRCQELIYDAVAQCSATALPHQLGSYISRLCGNLKKKVSDMPEFVQKSLQSGVERTLTRWPNR